MENGCMAKMTRADYIRSMNNTCLAKFLLRNTCYSNILEDLNEEIELNEK
jgi:hypothetical protein